MDGRVNDPFNLVTTDSVVTHCAKSSNAIIVCFMMRREEKVNVWVSMKIEK